MTNSALSFWRSDLDPKPYKICKLSNYIYLFERGNCRVFNYLQTHFWPKQMGCFATPLARNNFCFLYSILVLPPSTHFTHPFLLFVFFKIGMLRHLLVGQYFK